MHESTKKNYYSIWKSFNEFNICLDTKPTSWEDRLNLYIGYLIEFKKVQSQTVLSYISAIKSMLITFGNYQLNEDKFLLSSLTRTCKFQNDTVRTRLPIQKLLLKELLRSIDSYYSNCNQMYLAHMYMALFSTMYFSLFRVSELTKTEGSHTIKVLDVHAATNKKKLLFVLRSSKTHGYYTHPQLVKITSSAMGMELAHKPGFCPYHIINSYIKVWPKYHSDSEQFFIFQDFSSVTGSHMCTTLHTFLQKLQLNENLYNCHSFRLGCSCDLLKYGVPVDLIKKLGQWKSNIVYSYLKNAA